MVLQLLNSRTVHYTQLLFYAPHPLFSFFNGTDHYIPLVNLCSLIFRLMVFGWPCSSTLNPTYSVISYGNILGICLFGLRPLFQDCGQEIKQGLGVLTLILITEKFLASLIHTQQDGTLLLQLFCCVWSVGVSPASVMCALSVTIKMAPDMWVRDNQFCLPEHVILMMSGTKLLWKRYDCMAGM